MGYFRNLSDLRGLEPLHRRRPQLSNLVQKLTAQLLLILAYRLALAHLTTSLIQAMCLSIQASHLPAMPQAPVQKVNELTRRRRRPARQKRCGAVFISMLLILSMEPPTLRVWPRPTASREWFKDGTLLSSNRSGAFRSGRLAGV